MLNNLLHSLIIFFCLITIDKLFVISSSLLDCNINSGTCPIVEIMSSAPATRKAFIGGNWKCNGLKAQVASLVSLLNGFGEGTFYNRPSSV
jgi:hypothetical protein